MLFCLTFCIFFYFGAAKPYFQVKQLSIVTNPIINEVSGLAVSRRFPNILYVHNDSGDGPFIYAILANTGEVKSKIEITGAIHNDWEDIAYGVCPGEGYCIYIGDFGGNTANGSRNVIYRVKEPLHLNESQNVTIDATITFTWTEIDCEIIMVDPEGEIYLVSKNTGIPGKVVHVPSYAWNNVSKINLTDLISLSFHTGKPDPTGGDISPNGTEVVIISIDNLYYWHVANRDYLTTLSKDPVNLEYKDEPQGEAVGWDPSGSGFYTLSEGVNQTIYYYERVSTGPVGCAGKASLLVIKPFIVSYIIYFYSYL